MPALSRQSLYFDAGARLGEIGCWDRLHADLLRLLRQAGKVAPPPLSTWTGHAGGRWGTYWANKMADVFMSGHASAALGMAQHLIGKDRICRINPVTPEGRYTLDGVEARRWLKGLGVTEARKWLPEVQTTFLQEPAEEFSPQVAELTVGGVAP